GLPYLVRVSPGTLPAGGARLPVRPMLEPLRPRTGFPAGRDARDRHDARRPGRPHRPERRPSVNGDQVATAAIIAAVYGGGGLLLLWWWRKRKGSGRARNRAHSPARVASKADANLLEQPVKLPDQCGNGPYIESWAADVDVWDVKLAQLHDALWPGEEWIAVVECPDPEATAYATHAEATAQEPGGTPYECPCGRLHVHRRWRARSLLRPRRRPSQTRSSS
ncbi:hypothetical protein ACWF7W_46490, partial [Nonomuraea angiospora]